MKSLDTRKQQWGLGAGFGFLVLYMLGFVGFAGFIPATPPSWDGAEIAAMYAERYWGIMIGMLLCVIASPLLASWSISVFVQMRRIESGSPIYSYTQLLNGALLSAFFMLPPIIWATIGFRDNTDPATMLILNDLAWIAWLISWPYAFFQQLAIAACGLSEKSAQPLFPRWVCYLAAWTSVAMIPVGVILFVHRGPFAWNGIFGLYLAAGIYVVYYTAVTVSVAKAIGRQARDPRSAMPADQNLHATP